MTNMSCTCGAALTVIPVDTVIKIKFDGAVVFRCPNCGRQLERRA